MIKRLLIVFLFLILLPFVDAGDSLATTDATATWVRGIDSSVKTNFTVTNNGDTTLTNIAFVVGNLFLGNGTQLTETIANPSTITSLTVSASQNVTITITGIPSTQAIGTYTGNITTNYGTGNTTTSILTISVEDPSYDINTGNIAFPLADPNTTVSTTFLVKNTGNTALTNVNLSSNLDSKYSLTFDETTAFNLGKGESKEIIANVFVPYGESIGNHSIGTVDVFTDQKNFTSAYNVYINLEAKINIEDLDVVIDDNTETNVGDRERLGEKAEPGSKIELNFRLKNTFSEDSDIDMTHITITATLIDPDDEEIDEVDVDVGDLEADEKSNEKSILFELPFDVEEGEYTIEILVEGEDDNDVEHSLEWKIYFDVERKSHEIIIYKAYLTPETVKCTRTSNLYVKLMNIGAKTEDKVRLTIISSELDINIDERDIELSKDPDDDDNTYTKEVSVDAEDLAAGEYPITVKAYYDDDLLDDIKTVELVVGDCPKPEKKNETVIVQEPSEEKKEEAFIPITGEDIPVTTEISFMQSTSGIVFLVLANIVVLVIVVFLIAKFLIIPKIPKP